MTPTPPPGQERTDESPDEQSLDRRRVLAAGASLSAALVAGCSTTDGGSGGGGGGGDGGGGSDGGGSGGSGGPTGTFRLLISDQPVAIDEFDRLNVSFSRARIFRAGSDDIGDGDEAAGNTTTSPVTTSPTPTATSTSSGTATTTNSGTGTSTTTTEPEPTTPTDAPDEPEDDQEGFTVVDLDGATVDLTQVKGEKAMSVFEGGLSEGRYAKIELYAQRVDGVVDGQAVDVKIPSGKLQIVKPFEVVAGETLSFVFDINVVKKGKSGGYNLLPVIAKSGVAGQDVPVEEVGGDGGSGGPGDRENAAGDGGGGGGGDGNRSDGGQSGPGSGDSGGPPANAGSGS